MQGTNRVSDVTNQLYYCYKFCNRSAKLSQADSQKERVQISRITAQEQAELVSRYMKLRQEKLRSDNSEEKEKLNAQMIQVCYTSQ